MHAASAGNRAAVMQGPCMAAPTAPHPPAGPGNHSAHPPRGPPQVCAAGGPLVQSRRPAAAGPRRWRQRRPPAMRVAAGWAGLPASIAHAARSAAAAGHAAATAAGWGGGSGQRPRRPAGPACRTGWGHMMCWHNPQRRSGPCRPARKRPCVPLLGTRPATGRRLQPALKL